MQRTLTCDLGLIQAKEGNFYMKIEEHKCRGLSTGQPTYWPSNNNNPRKFYDLIDIFKLQKISGNS